MMLKQYGKAGIGERFRRSMQNLNRKEWIDIEERISLKGLDEEEEE